MQMYDHMALGNTLTALGVELPEELLTLGEKWNAVSSIKVDNPITDLRATAADPDVSADDLVAGVHAAAVTLTAQDRIRQVANELDRPLAVAFINVVLANEENFIAQLRKPFNAAAAQLADAAPLVPAGTQGEDVLNRGPNAAKAWQDLADAAATLDAVAEVRHQLARVYGLGVQGVENFIAPVAEPNDMMRARHAWRGSLDAVYELPQARGGHWQHLITAGFTLRLNTSAEAAAIANCAPFRPDPEPVAA